MKKNAIIFRFLRALSPLFISLLLATNAEAKRKDCFYPIHDALRRGGYVYGLNCRTTFVDKLKRVGRMTKGRWSFTVYDLSYHFLSNPGGPMHGDRRILFFDRRGRYVGQLEGPIDGDEKTRISKSTLFLDDPTDPGKRVDLGPHGLPHQCTLAALKANIEDICIYR